MRNNFQQTLQIHLAAIQQRDLAGFLATVADDPDLTIIMPNGAYVKGYQAAADLHRDWFADPDWSLETELIRTIETTELALALLLVNYADLDPAGQPYRRRYYLNLTFASRDGAWLLVYDQNTLTAEQPV